MACLGECHSPKICYTDGAEDVFLSPIRFPIKGVNSVEEAFQKYIDIWQAACIEAAIEE